MQLVSWVDEIVGDQKLVIGVQGLSRRLLRPKKDLSVDSYLLTTALLPRNNNWKRTSAFGS